MERKNQSIVVRVGSRATLIHLIQEGGKWRIRQYECTPPSRLLTPAQQNLFAEEFPGLQQAAEFAAGLIRSGAIPAGDDGYGGSALQRFSFAQ
jgi:hypothetical protein